LITDEDFGRAFDKLTVNGDEGLKADGMVRSRAVVLLIVDRSSMPDQLAVPVHFPDSVKGDFASTPLLIGKAEKEMIIWCELHLL
jgi:hypothetical protein